MSVPDFGDNPSFEFADVSESDARYLDAAPEIWRTIPQISERRIGYALEGDELVNFAIREAVDDPDNSMNGAIVAVAIWLGEQLVSESGGKWATVTDQYGSELAFVSKPNRSGDRSVIHPFSVVRKRLEGGTKFDSRGLVDALLRSIERM